MGYLFCVPESEQQEQRSYDDLLHQRDNRDPQDDLTQPRLVWGGTQYHWQVRTYDPWWRHDMGTFSALRALCVGNHPSPTTSDVELIYKLLNLQSLCLWFETPWSTLMWRHCNTMRCGLIVFKPVCLLWICVIFLWPSMLAFCSVDTGWTSVRMMSSGISRTRAGPKRPGLSAPGSRDPVSSSMNCQPSRLT